MAIKADVFAPIRETLFNIAMKSAKELVQAEYPDLNLDFLVVEYEEEVEDTQSETAHLGAKGQKVTQTGDEVVDQDPGKMVKSHRRRKMMMM